MGRVRRNKLDRTKRDGPLIVSQLDSPVNSEQTSRAPFSGIQCPPEEITTCPHLSLLHSCSRYPSHSCYHRGIWTAALKLLRPVSVGSFRYVLSTMIDNSTQNCFRWFSCRCSIAVHFSIRTGADRFADLWRDGSPAGRHKHPFYVVYSCSWAKQSWPIVAIWWHADAVSVRLHTEDGQR